MAQVPLLQRRRASEWEALGVVCPACAGTLADAAAALRCEGCAATYPVLSGIPDLRRLGDPYLSAADDAAAAERLLAREAGLAFAALYASYYEGNAKVPPAQVARFTHGVVAAADRADATLATWGELGGTLPPAGLVLDLGAGTAPLGVAIARAGRPVLALDAGLRWLLLARKRAADQGIDLPVVCANAEQLPLRTGSVAAVVGESILENVSDAEATLSAVHRALSPGGLLALTMPNRHSLGPDPHLGILAGGWRSEQVLRAHAERTGQVMPRRRLLAPGELTALLRRSAFRDVTLALPRFAAAQGAGLPLPLRGAIAGYHLARRIPVVNSIVLQVAPTIAAVARSA
jgi:SAM-dependent methyltransferase